MGLPIYALQAKNICKGVVSTQKPCTSQQAKCENCFPKHSPIDYTVVDQFALFLPLMPLIRIIAFGLLVFSCPAFAQTLTRKQIQEDASQHLESAITDLREFVLLPNDAHYPEQTRQNLNWCVKAMESRRFSVQVLYSDSVPYVFAQHISNTKLPTILIYMQADGQPVNPDGWFQKNPYEAVLKILSNNEWKLIDWKSPLDPDSRIFARSISDSKGPAMAFLAALDILYEKGIRPAFNIKALIDFQEEMGSPTLPALVASNHDLFSAKMVLIMDGTRHISNLPTLNFGARGIATVRLKVFGALTELHSGQYGNFAPNPVFKLAKLVGGMKDDSGRVTIPGYYDGVYLSDKEKAAINDMPGNDRDLLDRLGIAAPDSVGNTYEESFQYPSLNVRGLKAATVGDEVRTVIPSEALAEIDIRLVKETNGERQIGLLKDYIASRGYHFVDGTPTTAERHQYTNLISFEYRIGSKPFRTDLDSPEGMWLARAMDRSFGKDNYVKQRTTGGSQPIEPFVTSLGIPAVSIRIPNPDNNIHADNENLRIGNFLEGIEMCLGILTEKMDR